MSNNSYKRKYKMDYSFKSVDGGNVLSAEMVHSTAEDSAAKIFPAPAAGYASDSLTSIDKYATPAEENSNVQFKFTDTAMYKAATSRPLNHECIMDVRLFDLRYNPNVVVTRDFEELWKNKRKSFQNNAIRYTFLRCLSLLEQKCIADDKKERAAEMKSKEGLKTIAKESIKNYSGKGADYKKKLAEFEFDAEVGEDMDPLIGQNSKFTVGVVSAEAREVMRALVDCVIYLHKEGFGLTTIDVNSLVVKKNSVIPCFVKNFLIDLRVNNEDIRCDRMRQSFLNLKKFFEEELFNPGSSYPPDLADFLSLLNIKKSSNEEQIIERSTLIQEHLALKTGLECIEYLKTLLDRSKMRKYTSDWGIVMNSPSLAAAATSNWLVTLEGKPHSMWNFTVNDIFKEIDQKQSTYGAKVEDLFKSLRDLITHLCDTFDMTYESVYLIVLEAFPKLAHTLQFEIHKVETKEGPLRVCLMS